MRDNIKHDLSCGCLGFAWLRDKVQGYSRVFRCLEAAVRFSVSEKDARSLGSTPGAPRGSERRYLLYSLGFVGVRELLDFGSLQFRCLSSAPSDCPLGSPLCSLGHISLEDSHHNPCATCICGYEQCNRISTLPLYACNVQLHQVAA